MTRLNLVTLFVLLPLALWTCEASDGPVGNGDADSLESDSGPLTSDGSSVTPRDTTIPDTTIPDTLTPDTLTPDTTIADPEEILTPPPDVGKPDVDDGCPGCFGSPCSEHLDCNSGWCVDGADGLACTKTCNEDCPTGYSCRLVTQAGGDPVFLCLYDHVHYCRPCIDDEACRPPLDDTSTARCVELIEGDGSFCATPCAGDLECPAGGVCVDVEGEPTGLCQPTSQTCECSTPATLAQATTTCTISNDAGTCSGERACTEDGLTDCSAAVPTAELCDGLDNDCDDAVDEESAGTGASCDGDDEDLCQDGVMDCVDGQLGCTDDDTSAIELCNDADDDCDGLVDESFTDKGLACDGDDDDLCTEGLWTCDGEALVCADATGNAIELCNETDDDCDGTVDEGFEGKGDACDGNDADACLEGTLACDGQVLACSDATGDTPELCNEDDDDCDGEVDEAFMLKGLACDGDDADSCEEGLWICDGQGLVCSDDAVAVAELCNDADDDCDGQIDETFETKGTACDGDDADDCEGGTWVCQGNTLACDDDVTTTQAELCNSSDDDCDGSVDEDFPLAGLPCDGDDGDLCSDGEWLCDGTVLICTDDAGTFAEYCNNMDDDCDGEIDESYADKGTPCDGLDSDQCADGVWACSASGTTLECTDDEGTPAEVCDDIDNDCDGGIDEGFGLKGEPCDGLDDDLCLGGTWICDGTALYCTDDIASVTENCNTEDDDCDGAVDEGFEAAGDPCDGADTDLCLGGTLACNGVDLSCSDDDASITELCNGDDDDCDEAVDEAFPLLGDPCDGDDEDQCAGGEWICDGQVAICDDDSATIVELCNGEDDDCDGHLDEGFDGLGQSCDGGDSDLCEDGVWACTADGAGVACDDDEAASDELCNEEDDDCDGVVDEPFVLKGEACDGDDADHCATGVWVCTADGSALNCTDDDASSDEVCNDADDDCDSAVDETFADKGLPCDGEDDDQCKDGTWVCGAAGLICTDDGASLADTCNGVDDDCDGETDPGCCNTEGQSCCEGGTCNAPLSCSDGVCVCGAEAGVVCEAGDVWWTDCHGELSAAKDLCGSCGCVGGTCNHVDPPICVPGQDDSQSEDCGDCGTRTQTRTCLDGCTWESWSGWGDCSGQGACGVGDVDTDTQYIDCGLCGTQQQQRTRTCSDSCGWGGWTGWSDVGTCSDAGICSPNQPNTETQYIACGNCGTQQQQRTQTCTDSCQWGSFGNWTNVGSCTGSGPCYAGQQNSNTQYVGCGNCGSQQQQQTQTCSDSCQWGGWSGWSNVGGCSGSGPCYVGQQNTNTQYVGCGNCGSQQQTQTQTCTGSCQWGGWTGWSNVGGCAGSGPCSVGAPESQQQTVACGSCGEGSQSQTRSRTCSGSCQWGSWSGWSNVGGCSGQGCVPGTTTDITGNCGLCDEGITWDACTDSCTWTTVCWGASAQCCAGDWEYCSGGNCSGSSCWRWCDPGTNVFFPCDDIP